MLSKILYRRKRCKARKINISKMYIIIYVKYVLITLKYVLMILKNTLFL